MRLALRKLACCESASVAPTVALSLLGLIAAGGLAFDYARLASMDTELQNAADQAALAAASQLDRKANACERANAAAQSLVTNQTLFANDGNGIAVTLPSEPACDAVGSIRFYQDKAKTTPADADTNARFVEVTVNGRTAEYALTPVVGAFSSGQIAATAFAGMGSAICKVPPLMLCNPNPGTPFDPEAWRGAGLKLFQGGGGSWAPGSFGYLDVGATNSGAPDQRLALGMDFPNTNCVADEGVEVDTGVSASVLDALNVRFDLFQNGWARNTCYPHSDCSPAYNSTKDIVRKTAPAANSCGFNSANSQGWTLPPVDEQYIPENAAGDDSNVVLMGYPMDTCHFPNGGGCPAGRFGNGEWRRDIYFATNHPNLSVADGSNWQIMTGLGPTASRFDFYRWEQNAGVGNNAGSLPEVTGGTGNLTQYGRAVCKPPGLQAGGNQADRRVLAAAVADNCSELSGGAVEVDVGAWAEVFLVQPSVDRPAAGVSANEIYVEIIGASSPTDSGAAAQVVIRDVPYLIE